MNEFEKAIDTLKEVDSIPWYWVEYQKKNQYGTKKPGMYRHKVVAAVPRYKEMEPPPPGSKLWSKGVAGIVGVGGLQMNVCTEILETFDQDGAAFCEFVARAHAHHVLGAGIKETG